MKIGDKVQYNKRYNPKEVVLILDIDKTHALIQFPSGSKIATPINGLWPIQKNDPNADLTGSESGTVDTNI